MKDSPAPTTVAQALLLAAAKLPEPFHLNALAVQAWREAPEKFGLKGFALESCDVNIAAYTVMGDRGLAARGWLEKVAPKTYKLSDKGRAAIGRIRAGEPLCERVLPPARPRLPARAGYAVADLLDSPVMAAWLQAARTVGESMRRAVWDRVPPEAVAEFVATANRPVRTQYGGDRVRRPPLEVAVRCLKAGPVTLPDGREVTVSELDELDRCLAWVGGRKWGRGRKTA